MPSSAISCNTRQPAERGSGMPFALSSVLCFILPHLNSIGQVEKILENTQVRLHLAPETLHISSIPLCRLPRKFDPLKLRPCRPELLSHFLIDRPLTSLQKVTPEVRLASRTSLRDSLY